MYYWPGTTGTIGQVIQVLLARYYRYYWPGNTGTIGQVLHVLLARYYTNWTRLLLTCILPLVALVGLNTKIFLGIRYDTHQSNQVRHTPVTSGTTDTSHFRYYTPVASGTTHTSLSGTTDTSHIRYYTHQSLKVLHTPVTSGTTHTSKIRYNTQQFP